MLQMKHLLLRRLLRDQTLTVSLKKPWQLLAETTLRTRTMKRVAEKSSAWWTLLVQLRTHFEAAHRPVNLSHSLEMKRFELSYQTAAGLGFEPSNVQYK